MGMSAPPSRPVTRRPGRRKLTIAKPGAEALRNAAWHIALDIANDLRGTSAADVSGVRRSLERELVSALLDSAETVAEKYRPELRKPSQSR